MRNAKSAKVAMALGATLFAITVQVSASEIGSKVNSLGSSSGLGIDAGGVRGIDAGGVRGIDAGGVRGIDAGGVWSIDASSVLGIDAGGVRGIDAGGVRGIDAGGVWGIDAGGVRGIDAGGVWGIDAGGVRGIDAGGVWGIDAGGVRGIDAGGAWGIDAGGVRGIDASDLLAGPVDSIDRMNGVFESMGQIVMASQSMLSTLKVGQLVSVRGSVVAAGWLYADDVSVSTERYIPGATRVFVSGLLSSVNTRNGTAQMGDLTIDYTPSLGAGKAPAGALWGFHGIIPRQRGMMISEGSGPR